MLSLRLCYAKGMNEVSMLTPDTLASHEREPDVYVDELRQQLLETIDSPESINLPPAGTVAVNRKWHELSGEVLGYLSEQVEIQLGNQPGETQARVQTPMGRKLVLAKFSHEIEYQGPGEEAGNTVTVLYDGRG